jgi:biotin carboxylase
MNLLVTNTYNPQCYAIITALRPYAQKIVATMEGGNRFSARLSQAANSRFVDRRYRVPSPIEDWQAGNLRRENTEREEAFIQAVVKICRVEKIDVIFPSWDPYVYIFSKNKALFEAMGIVIPVPDYETTLMALDKYRSIQAAREVGFPCPRTYLYECQDDLRRIADKERFPLVIKARVGSGGRGVAIVKDYPELLETLPAIVEKHGNPMIQEYIPGRQRVSFPVVLDRNGDLKFAFDKKIVRNFRVTTRFGAVEESVFPDPQILKNARKLLKKLGWWGSVSVSTLRDPRDGLCKLIEINPRFSRNMWHRTELGVNEPWMCIKIAKREPVDAPKEYPEGTLLVCPIEDIQLLTLQLIDLMIYKFRTRVLKNAPVDRFSAPKSMPEQIRSFMRTYLGGQKKVFDPHFRYFFRDPIVSILWWLRFSTWVIGALKHAGR